MRDKLVPWVILVLLCIIVYLSQEQWMPYVMQSWDWLNDHSEQIGLLDGVFAIVGTIVALLMGYLAFFGNTAKVALKQKISIL